MMSLVTAVDISYRFFKRIYLVLRLHWNSLYFCWLTFYALKFISYILLFKNKSAEKSIEYEQFGVVKEQQPILPGSQQLEKQSNLPKRCFE